MILFIGDRMLVDDGHAVSIEALVYQQMGSTGF